MFVCFLEINKNSLAALIKTIIENKLMEYDLVNRPHQHPLLFKKMFDEDAEVAVCSRCRLPMHPPSYTCSDSHCNFHIHESCLHLPFQILNSPFHPQHPLHFNINPSYSFCRACGEDHWAMVYRCDLCWVVVDIKCAIQNMESTKTSGFWIRGQYVHFSHSHPLTLSLSMQQQQQPNILSETRIIKKVICVMCKRYIQSTSSYFCSHSECVDIHFHKQCAELPRVFKNTYFHPHPLLLFLYKFDYECNNCNSCRNKCIGWVYTCPICHFFLHLPCLQSLNHTHTFTNMISNYISFICTLCGKKCDDEFPWYCDYCHTLVHKRCSELQSTIITTEHNHVLTLNYYFSGPYTSEIVCQICGEVMDRKYGGYACSTCNNFSAAHLECCAQTEIIIHDTPADHNGDEQKNLMIKPLFRLHPHPLTLISLHPDFVSQCDVCLQHFNGSAYHCQTCLSTLDVRCATLKHPYKHPNHQHPLYLYKNALGMQYQYCDACGKTRDFNTLAFRCSLCNFYLDIRCATLPIEVRYRFDPHPLRLTYMEDKEEGMGEYYCDICEEEREIGMWFYSCGKCKYEAHTRCVLGEFPYVKSGKHKSHNHPLSLETLKTLGKQDSKVVFGCGVCNFTLDTMEERSLTFIDLNHLSTAIQLYDYHHQPIAERHIGASIIRLGPFGDQSAWFTWKEWVFSTISAFIVFMSGQNVIDGIQIQYEKNGRLVWSKLRGTGSDIKFKVICFDYPDEYLVSIDGSVGNQRSWSGTGITSLTLKTNRNTYGPFGYEDILKFSSDRIGVKIIGIFGTDLYSLKSIGFYGVSTEDNRSIS